MNTRASRFPSEQKSRIEWWRRLIFRQQSAVVPLTQFCQQMGVSTRKFYYWTKRLRQMDAASSDGHVIPSGSPRLASAVAQSTLTGFVPVSIINPGTTTHQLEIELANGCAVRLTGAIGLGPLQAAISAAGQLDGLGRGDH